MSFEKLQEDINQLVQKSTPKESVRMTEPEFLAYAQKQVTLARAELQKGRKAAGTRRLEALKKQTDVIAKFEFGSRDLPAVTVYKDPEQLETTEEEIKPVVNQSDGKTNWTSKLAKQLAETLQELSNRPTDKNEGGETPPAGDPPDDDHGETPPAKPPAGDPLATPPKPAKEPVEGAPNASEKSKKAGEGLEWPNDLAKSIHKNHRDDDKDYDWGRDAR